MKTENFRMNCNSCNKKGGVHPCYLFNNSTAHSFGCLRITNIRNHLKENEHYFLRAKTPTDIQELDEIVSDNLLSYPTLICGDESKTLLAMEFLARGVIEHDEPGVFITFEESAKNLISHSTWI